MNQGVPPKKPAKRQTDLFNLIGNLRTAMKLGPCIDTIWHHVIGDWSFAVNGHPKHQSYYPRNSDSTRIPPYSIVFWYKGGYVGWCNPKFAIIAEEYAQSDGSTVFDINNLEKIIKDEIRAAR